MSDSDGGWTQDIADAVSIDTVALLVSCMFGLVTVWITLALWSRVQKKYQQSTEDADKMAECMQDLVERLSSVVVERQRLMSMLYRHGEFEDNGTVAEWEKEDEVDRKKLLATVSCDIGPAWGVLADEDVCEEEDDEATAETAESKKKQ